MKKIEYILILTMWLMAFAGCVKEDLDDCPPVVVDPEPQDERILHFKTKHSKYPFEQYVENVRLLAYDKNNQYLRDTVLSANELWAMSYAFNLTDWKTDEEEIHHIVGLMNPADCYLVEDEYVKHDFRKSVVTYRPDTVDYKLADMYLGELQFTTPVKATYRDTICLAKNTNHVRLEIEFPSSYQLPENSRIVPVIRGSNGTYNASNKCIGTTTIVYEPHTYVNETLPVLKYDFTILQMYIGDDVEVVIERQDYLPTRAILDQISLRLTEYLAQIVDSSGYYLYNTDEKLEEEDQYYLRIVLDEDLAIAEVIVNNWFVIKPGVDL